MSKVLIQTACPNPSCGSSDAFTIYSDASGAPKDATCFSCMHWTNDQATLKAALEGDTKGSIDAYGKSKSKPQQTPVRRTEERLTVEECNVHPIREIKDRGLTKETCEKYGVRIGVDTSDGSTPIYHLYPVFRDEDLVGYKQRFVKDKSFRAIGDTKNPSLFGSNVVNPTGKKLFITEGELDALSLYQILKQNSDIDWNPSVVSLPNGCSSVGNVLSESLDLLDGYEQIVLVFDNDSPGKAAAKEACKILAGKVYTVKYSLKDPNEMLVKGRASELKWAVLTGARKYQPDGILSGEALWDRYKEVVEQESFPYPSTMQDLNDKTYGVRPGSVVTVTSGSGCGKTQFLRELKYHYFETTDHKIADISLEEDCGDTVSGLLSLHLNKRIGLPDVEVDQEAEREAFEHMFGSGRISLYDFFGGMDDDNLFSKLKYFAATGHKFIFIDHLSIIISEYADAGGERERIDAIMTKLAKFVKETGTIVFLVVHLKKASGTPFEEGGIPSLDDLRGSGGIKQLSWDVIGLSRNQQHPDPKCANTTEVTVLKCRFTGRTGQAGFLYYDDTTGRMFDTPEPPRYREVRRVGK